MSERPLSTSSALAICDLKFSYGNARPVIDLSSLEIKRGESVFIYGPSGCGKTTLLSLIAGIIPPGTGQLSILGQDMKSLTNRARDRFRGEHIGYIFQSFNLIPYLTVKENILLPYKITPSRINKDADLAQQVQKLASHLGLSNLLEQKVTELSIGQQQRVAGARAFLGSPELIVADEPTSALDDKNTNEFMALIKSEIAQKGSTLLFVSHDQRLATHFNRTVYLPEINRAVSHEESN